MHRTLLESGSTGWANVPDSPVSTPTLGCVATTLLEKNIFFVREFSLPACHIRYVRYNPTTIS
jgi:hypothetical protein